ncbi:hypothetical protein [Mastigocoleus testarum]|uniref:Uncharacterized protein n=1 Tax=Mastigocoleus testarum BC008 TaxID=371196 RepID=A0A0V7ZD19_9CYAN|nr:hypothetical protein [Mastigocoleus testarum]KST62448.1 hypothetical protein BC008_09785 [Mastigocoleus testarum BC008]
MGGLFEEFQNWLQNSRDFLLSWFPTNQKEAQEPEALLTELPPSLRSKLVAAVENLPINSAELEAIHSRLDEVFKEWRDDPKNADNSFVILTSPVSTVLRILTEDLDDNWAQEHKVSLRPLQLDSRPVQQDIITELRRQIDVQESAIEEKKSEVIVIPNLNWCYLRCFEGLEGIDYLQDLLLQNHSRFWIIGSGLVGWEYLNHVSHFKAYCGNSLVLPKLEGEQLQTWLEPIIDEFEISFGEIDTDDDDPMEAISDSEESRSNQTKYFDRLASLSEGVSSVAVEVFLHSLCYEPAESDIKTETKKTETNTGIEKGSGVLRMKTPDLPLLPRLEQDDLYILYSIVLHGDLTLSALADSLGDRQSLVKGRVRILRRMGIIEQQDDILSVNPIHYPRVKRELDNNNFIIDEFD